MNTDRTAKIVRAFEDELEGVIVYSKDEVGPPIPTRRFLNWEQAHSWLGQHNYIGLGRNGEYVRLGQ